MVSQRWVGWPRMPAHPNAAPPSFDPASLVRPASAVTPPVPPLAPPVPAGPPPAPPTEPPSSGAPPEAPPAPPVLEVVEAVVELEPPEPVAELEPPEPVVALVLEVVETDVVPVAVARPPAPPELVVPPFVTPTLPPVPVVETWSPGESEQASAVIPTASRTEIEFQLFMMKSPVAGRFGRKRAPSVNGGFRLRIGSRRASTSSRGPNVHNGVGVRRLVVGTNIVPRRRSGPRFRERMSVE